MRLAELEPLPWQPGPEGEDWLKLDVYRGAGDGRMHYPMAVTRTLYEEAASFDQYERFLVGAAVSGMLALQDVAPGRASDPVHVAGDYEVDYLSVEERDGTRVVAAQLVDRVAEPV